MIYVPLKLGVKSRHSEFWSGKGQTPLVCVLQYGLSEVTEQKRQLSVVRSRIMQRAQLASDDGFRDCERIASRQVDMVVDERR